MARKRRKRNKITTKLTDKEAVNWMVDKKHTCNPIDKYLHMYAVDAVMLTDKLTLMGKDFQWHVLIHYMMS